MTALYPLPSYLSTIAFWGTQVCNIFFQRITFTSITALNIFLLIITSSDKIATYRGHNSPRKTPMKAIINKYGYSNRRDANK